MISCLRSRGLPARYVSGYLRTNATQAEGGEKLVGDAASHAWVAVWSPPYGWIEFDPTNGCFAGHRPHRRGLGPGFRRRVAAARRDPGRRRSQVVGDGAGGAE